MRQNQDYRDAERQRSIEWKRTTATLPDPARLPAPYVGKNGLSVETPHEFCLPAEFARHNLLPENRAQALRLFAALGIPWHCGVDGGPGNHLLSSQVQCVNALAGMVTDPGRALRAFRDVLDIAEVLEIEPRRYLTFEYIGPSDYFGECESGERVRGAHCTSVDAALLYETSRHTRELALIEWKYTEEYRRRRRPEPGKDATRRRRYFDDWSAVDGPLRADVVPFRDMLDEPFYQLMRQQLLAHRLEQERVMGVDTVRVVHVLPPANTAYQESLLRPSHRDAGNSVDEVWAALLRRPDRFVHLDPAVFLDPSITSREYVARYG